MKIDFKIVVVQLLPTFMRQTKLYSFVYSMVHPLSIVKNEWDKTHRRNIITVNQNGQVCRLRGLLNDTFDSTNRAIEIIDGITSDWQFVWRYDSMNVIANPQGTAWMLGKSDSVDTSVPGKLTMIYNTGNTGVSIISQQGTMGSIGYDFIVKISAALKESNASKRTMFESQVISLVNANKLASKRYRIEYKQN